MATVIGGIFGMEPCRVGITSHLAKLLTGGFPPSDHAVAFHQNTVVGKQVFDTSVVYLQKKKQSIDC